MVCGAGGLGCIVSGGLPLPGGKGHPMGDIAAASFRVRLSEGHIPRARRVCAIPVNCVMLL